LCLFCKKEILISTTFRVVVAFGNEQKGYKRPPGIAFLLVLEDAKP